MSYMRVGQFSSRKRNVLLLALFYFERIRRLFEI